MNIIFSNEIQCCTYIRFSSLVLTDVASSLTQHSDTLPLLVRFPVCGVASRK